MSKDVVFECPNCRQWLEAPPDMIALFVECPTCKEIIKVPSVSSSPSSSTAEKTTRPPPPKPDEKGTTMRIDLPPNLGIPSPPSRRFVIRRKS